MQFLDFKEKLLLFLTLANNRRMPSKIHSNPRKDSHADSKKVEQLERLRIIQDNLVFVSGLPTEIADSKLLKNELYFGRYGKVLKVVINSSPAFRKNGVAQAYVTYGSEIQASLAIVALDGFNLDERPLKVSYGTTKYCTHFLRGHQCVNSECFYLHKLDKSREVANGDVRNNFQQQNDRAFDVVSEHLEEVIKKLIEEGEQNPDQGFPSLAEMIEFLVDSKFLSKAKVDHLIEKHRIDVPLKLQTTMSTPPATQKPSGNDSPKETKLIKCNSLSTMASPTKSQIEQKIAQKTKKTQMSQKIENTQKKEVQNQQPQNIRREQGLEQKIEKMIIKKVFATGAHKSQLNFVNTEKSSQKHSQELTKLKGIVQRYLIATN